MTISFTSNGEIASRINPGLYALLTALGAGAAGAFIPSRFVFSMSGETFGIGEDSGAAVGPYEQGFAFTGTIKQVEIELKTELDQQFKEAMQQGQIDAALSSQ